MLASTSTDEKPRRCVGKEEAPALNWRVDTRRPPRRCPGWCLHHPTAGATNTCLVRDKGKAYRTYEEGEGLSALQQQTAVVAPWTPRDLSRQVAGGHADHDDGLAAAGAAALLLLLAADCLRLRGSRKKALLVRKLQRRHGKMEGALRLTGCRGPHEGNVEILHMGKWGSVCDDEWDLREAAVVCRQLGFRKPERVAHSSMFGPARRRYWLDNVYCTGEEARLSDCRSDGWGSHDCTDSEAAGVVCRTSEPAAPAATSDPPPEALVAAPRTRTHIKKANKGKLHIRLAGGRIPEEGRVEVKFGKSGAWGVICGDGWSLLEAMVVCHQLGLGYANSAAQTDFFGGNVSDVLLSGVQCRGTETSLDHCLHDPAGRVACPGRTDDIAAVVCVSRMADLVIDHLEIARTAHLEDKQLFFLQCAMEENCLASAAYTLKSENVDNWHLETRRLLRFTARTLNAGTADFRPIIPKHLWEFHQCHMHYHSMEVFATFDVFDGRGVRVAEGHKASFCLEDNQCMPGVEPAYACANFGDQGVSVNCSDIYKFNIDCQWVDISELKPGAYTFKVSVNPEFKIPEMSYENNAATCSLLYTETFVHVHNCSVGRP
ncbi:lysyl oxidase homolog 3 [Bacillus rossius redtenbacheri]|uniref:lysyl oxidase homolog 3 n=1 Tax=Bacillus rossius redtenbacheri TaxID=93214 RepID=UPI002FDE48BF